MVLYKMLYYAQAQPRASTPGRVEGLEYAFHVLSCPFTGIHDLHPHFAALRGVCPEHYLRALGAVLDRVLKQVQKHLKQALRITDHYNLLGIVRQYKLDPGRLMKRGMLPQVHDPPAYGREVLFLEMHPLHRLAQVEHVVHQGREPVHLQPHVVEELLVLGVVLKVLGKGVGDGHYGVQGVSHLVGHTAGELADDLHLLCPAQRS